MWHAFKIKHATHGTFAFLLIPRVGDNFVQGVVSKRWADSNFMGRGESYLPPPHWQDDGVVRVAGDALLHGTHLTQSTTDPGDMGQAGDTQWYNTASTKRQGGA